MLSRISPELLVLVASHLPNHEQYKCLMVCKRWYQAMLRAVYKNIYIKNRRQLKLLLQHLSEQPEAGRFIRHLQFKQSSHRLPYKTNQGTNSKSVSVTTVELEQLSIYCPYLESIDFDQSIWRYVKLPSSMTQQLKRSPAITMNSRTADQLIWKAFNNCSCPFDQLTQLKLSGEIVTQLMIPALFNKELQQYAGISISTSPLIQCLKRMPQIQILNLDSRQPKSHVINVFIEDMEAIHLACPLLKELTLIGSFNLIPTMNNVRNNNAAALSTQKYQNLRKLKLIASIAPAWFYYIGFKYPELEELDLDSIITPVVYEYQSPHKKPSYSVSSEVRSSSTSASNLIMYLRQQLTQHELELPELEIQSLFCHLLDCCPRLRKIELDSASAKRYITKPFFQKYQSTRQSTKLKEIKLKTDTSYNFINQREFLELLVNQGQDLITGFGTEVIFNDNSDIVENSFTSAVLISQQLSRFSKLTELALCGGHPYVECEIDLLLNHCPKLEQLRIRSAHVVVLENDDKNNNKQQHPLKALHLSTVSISPRLFEYLGTRCHTLSELSFYECEQRTGDQITSQNQSSCINICMPHNHLKSVILNGIRLDSVPLVNHSWTPNARLVSLETPQKGKRWYHAYNAQHYYPEEKGPKIQKLNERKTNIAEHYYQYGWINNRKHLEKIISRKYNTGSIAQQQPHYLYSRSSRDWEADLFFGYVAIQCRSLQHWELNCNTTYNEF